MDPFLRDAAEVEQLWQKFDRQRNEIEGADYSSSPLGEAAEERAAHRPHPIFARRRRAYWK
jgi:hypothetical protein